MHFLTLHGPFPDRFTAERNALLPRLRVRGFGSPLIPDHFRRQTPRPVSYYALLKWWLLLSQHPGCHGNLTSLRTQRRFGALAGGLDCSPFDDGYCHSPSISRVLADGIRSLVERGRLVAPNAHPVALPPSVALPRLTLKLFRRERAISQFDYTLSPPHSSSHVFSTTTSSGLQAVLPALHPGHG